MRYINNWLLMGLICDSVPQMLSQSDKVQGGHLFNAVRQLSRVEWHSIRSCRFYLFQWLVHTELFYLGSAGLLLWRSCSWNTTYRWFSLRNGVTERYKPGHQADKVGVAQVLKKKQQHKLHSHWRPNSRYQTPTVHSWQKPPCGACGVPADTQGLWSQLDINVMVQQLSSGMELVESVFGLALFAYWVNTADAVIDCGRFHKNSVRNAAYLHEGRHVDRVTHSLHDQSHHSRAALVDNKVRLPQETQRGWLRRGARDGQSQNQPSEQKDSGHSCMKETQERSKRKTSLFIISWMQKLTDL